MRIHRWKYFVLISLFLLTACTTPIISTRPLNKSEGSIGIAMHYSPQSKDEVKLGMWFGYGINDKIDVFVDPSFPFMLIGLGTKKAEESIYEYLPGFAIRWSGIISDRTYSWGLSNMISSNGDMKINSNFGAFLGLQDRNTDNFYDVIMFSGYNRIIYGGDKEDKTNNIKNGYNMMLVTKYSLRYDDKADNEKYGSLSLAPSIWLSNNKPLFKDITFEIRSEFLSK